MNSGRDLTIMITVVPLLRSSGLSRMVRGVELLSARLVDVCYSKMYPASPGLVERA